MKHKFYLKNILNSYTKIIFISCFYNKSIQKGTTSEDIPEKPNPYPELLCFVLIR